MQVTILAILTLQVSSVLARPSLPSVIPRLFALPNSSTHWRNAERKLRAALDILPQLNLKGLISHHFPFAQAAQAYAEVDQHPERSLQVVLTYGS